ncbi:hypothetical protein [Variovorax sp. J31P207]|uniref:hypothetical protein n=1 Tax=Variovorax sp. J31P207 TaxID=3053510 RepID=UPI002575704E|nr:hypothetical protein [Variovorax sp. J31P207]MDM0066888.1 hypothetical protein [Variovorax sp. J31P207]
MNPNATSPYLWTTESLTWSGESFAEQEAARLWWYLPVALQAIARREIGAGNTPKALQLDRKTFVSVMTFSKPPSVPFTPEPGVSVHTTYAPGNYCYDGTACTYELTNSSRISML